VTAAFSVPIIAIERCGADIITLRLERPEDYAFRAGQWFRLTLETSDGEQARTFSHAAAPADSWLELTTRLSTSAFKQTLAAMAPGDSVAVGPPGGRFALPEGADALTFIVGGVGITPVRSMLRDARQAGRAFSDALVIFGNRDVSCEPYVQELLSMKSSGVRVVRVLERPDKDWQGERGLVDADLLGRHGAIDGVRSFIVAGPPLMVEAMLGVLDEVGIDRDAVRFESFGKLDPGVR
jgi:ferredoxin-NADP reductase